MDDRKIIHYNRSGSWRIVIPLSIILCLLSTYPGLSFYSYSLFLFVGGIISYLVNHTKYAEMNRSELKIYTFFPYLSKSIIIRWTEVKNIEPSTIVRKLAVGGSFGGPLEPFERDTVSINLAKKLNDFENYSFEKNQKRFFHPTIEVRNEGLEVVIIKRPTEGYKSFCEDCSTFATVTRINGVSDYKRENNILIDISAVVLISLIVWGMILLTKP